MIGADVHHENGPRKILTSTADSRAVELFQESVDFDFTSSAEIDMSVDDDRDHETSSQGGAIALGDLCRGVNRCTKFIGVERIEDGGFVVGAVPCFGGDGPDDCVLVAIGGDRRCRAGILKLCLRGCG